MHAAQPCSQGLCSSQHASASAVSAASAVGTQHFLQKMHAVCSFARCAVQGLQECQVCLDSQATQLHTLQQLHLPQPLFRLLLLQTCLLLPSNPPHRSPQLQQPLPQLQLAAALHLQRPHPLELPLLSAVPSCSCQLPPRLQVSLCVKHATAQLGCCAFLLCCINTQ